MALEEEKEFENQSKIMKNLWIKKNLRGQGIDTTKISQQELDEVRRGMDKNQQIQQKYNGKFMQLNGPYQQASTKINEDSKKLNEEYQAASTKLNKEMQTEIAEAQAEVDKIILQIKKDQGLVQPSKVEEAGTPVAEPVAEPKPEGTVN
jgi:hypothetical protein